MYNLQCEPDDRRWVPRRRSGPHASRAICLLSERRARHSVVLGLVAASRQHVEGWIVAGGLGSASPAGDLSYVELSERRARCWIASSTVSTVASGTAQICDDTAGARPGTSPPMVENCEPSPTTTCTRASCPGASLRYRSASRVDRQWGVERIGLSVCERLGHLFGCVHVATDRVRVRWELVLVVSSRSSDDVAGPAVDHSTPGDVGGVDGLSRRAGRPWERRVRSLRESARRTATVAVPSLRVSRRARVRKSTVRVRRVLFDGESGCLAVDR